jgi:hypothetical protein
MGQKVFITGATAAAAERSAWQNNDSLRRDAAPTIAGAATDVGVVRYIQESITVPYVDGADQWIDERCERNYNSATDSVAAARTNIHCVDQWKELS